MSSMLAPTPIQPVALPQFAPLQARRRLLWPAMAVLALVLGGVGYKYLLKPDVPPTGSLGHDLTELDLTATVENDLLRITWNKSSPAIASAKQAILSIADRAARRQLTLSTDQLQAGALVYPHESDDVTVRLRVVGSDRETTESARILRARQAGTPAPPQARAESASTRVETPPVTVNQKPVPDPAPPAVKTPVGTPLTDSSRSKTPAPLSRSEAEKAKADIQQPPAVAANEKPVLDSTPAAVKPSSGAAPVAPSPSEKPVTLPRSEAAEVNVPQPAAPPPASQSAPPKPSVVPAAKPDCRPHPSPRLTLPTPRVRRRKRRSRPASRSRLSQARVNLSGLRRAEAYQKGIRPRRRPPARNSLAGGVQGLECRLCGTPGGSPGCASSPLEPEESPGRGSPGRCQGLHRCRGNCGSDRAAFEREQPDGISLERRGRCGAPVAILTCAPRQSECSE